MKSITQQHLINAFGGESMAHMRYIHFTNTAEKEIYTNRARLFNAIAYAEYIHADNHCREFKHLNGDVVANSGGTFGPRDTLKNLKLAVMGETFEVEEIYPVNLGFANNNVNKEQKKPLIKHLASKKNI